MLHAPRRGLGLALSTLIVLGCNDDRGATTTLTTPPLTTFGSDPGDSNDDDSDPPNTSDTGDTGAATPTSSSDPGDTSDPTTSDPTTSDPTTSDPTTSDPSTTSTSETTDPTRPDPSTTDTGIDESTGSTTDDPPPNTDQPASGLFSGCQVEGDCDGEPLCWTSPDEPMPGDGYCTTLCFSDAECGEPLAVPAALVCFNADMGFGFCAYVCSLDLECPTGMLCKPSGLNPGTNLCY